MGITAKQAIAKAKYYIGYEEKASNKDLEDFHKNAGRNNFQKFQPLAGAGNGDQWCQYFIDGIFVEMTGSIREARKILYMGNSSSAMTGYTPDGKQYFVDAGRWFSTPEPGDIIYFYSTNKNRVGHVGIVTEVNKQDKTLLTVEGNTSSTEYHENGGCVASHKYSYATIGGTNRVNGFGRPNYSKEQEDKWNVIDKKQFIRDMYVSELYREPSQAEINDWIKKIDNGMDYNTALNTFRQSDEGKRAWITMMYKTLLDRDPDQDGLEAWFTAMKKGGKSRADVLAGFKASEEYKEWHKNDRLAR